MKGETNNILEARRFSHFLKDLGIESPIQCFEKCGDEIFCATAQVVIMVSEGKAMVTWTNDGSVAEYLVEEEGKPLVFRAFRECKKIPKGLPVMNFAVDDPVKKYQIQHHVAM